MFRFNNPDALLVLLMTAAAYCLMRAVLTASWRWLALVGVVMGLAFLTKMLQAFLVLPGFALAYLLLAPTTWVKRLLHLLAALAALIAAAGWWVLTVQLVPASMRPYIGGSTDNTVLDLAFGYNGISRITGHHREGIELGDDSGGSGLAALSGRAGLHRLFSAETGNEISWLLPVALFALAFGVYLAARRILSRGELCALVIWGSWLLVTGLVLSYMGGVIHPYYTVALAPAIAALIGMGGLWAWRRRPGWDGRFALGAMVALAAASSAVLLHRNNFNPTLTQMVVGFALIGTLGVLLAPRRAIGIAAAVGILAGLAGTTTFSIVTTTTPHRGSIPTAARASKAPAGWMNDEATNEELACLLKATHTPWSAATNGSQSAAALEIASGTSVMAVGGWSSDPVPTLQQFIDDVHAGKVSYFVAAGDSNIHGEVIRGPNHSASHTREIADWVAAHYPATTIGGSTVYRFS
jgi:4-amino-4-deoxy-L-arabinose transferase-like glycosyltransferase